MSGPRFKEGDRIRRVTDYHRAGGGSHDFKDRECVMGSVGVVKERINYYKLADDRHVYEVAWDHKPKGSHSHINEECLDFELPEVTPEEEAEALKSILRGLQ